MIIMIPGTPFQTCGKDILRKWSFQTSGSSRNDPDPFIDPCPYCKLEKVLGKNCRWWKKSCTTLGCMKLCKYYDICHINWLAGFFSFNSMVGVNPLLFEWTAFLQNFGNTFTFSFCLRSWGRRLVTLGIFPEFSWEKKRKKKHLFQFGTLRGQQFSTGNFR